MAASVETVRPADPLISLVVPVFNEEDSVGLFTDTVKQVFRNAPFRYEIVFVNDGSTDRTWQRLRALADQEPCFCLVNLSRNFGKEIALTAGIDHARGDAVVPMDVDLQDPPELVLTFVERWQEGYDVVYGVRKNRKFDTFTKRVSAAVFYRVINHLSQVKMPENAGDFRLIDRRVVNVLKQLPERTRFMKGLFAWVGFPSIAVSYDRQPRAAGITKWSQWRLWNLALEGVTSFSTAPLRIWTYLGLAVAAMSFALGTFILLRTLLFGADLPGYASLITTVTFLGGIQLLSIGVLGEYLGRVFSETKQRPVYIVESVHPATGEESARLDTVSGERCRQPRAMSDDMANVAQR